MATAATIEKIRRLAEQSPFEGERAAARLALERMGAPAAEPKATREHDFYTRFTANEPLEQEWAFANANERRLAILIARDLSCRIFRVPAERASKRRRRQAKAIRWAKRLKVRGATADVLAAQRRYESLRHKLRDLLAHFARGFVAGVTLEIPKRQPNWDDPLEATMWNGWIQGSKGGDS